MGTESTRLVDSCLDKTTGLWDRWILAEELLSLEESLMCEVLAEIIVEYHRTAPLSSLLTELIWLFENQKDFVLMNVGKNYNETCQCVKDYWC